MRRMILTVALAVCALPATARAQSANTSVQGFGGFTFGTSSVLGSPSMSPTFGGAVTADLTPHIQLVGEVGRMSDIKAPLLDLLDFTPLDLRVSAWYGEGGVRFIAAPHSVVRPYVEADARQLWAEATARFGRDARQLSFLRSRANPLRKAA